MQLNKFIKSCFFVMMLINGSNAFAECFRNEAVKTTVVSMDVGRVVIPPTARVGDIVYSYEQTITSSGGTNYHCTTPTKATFVGKLINPGRLYGDGIYETNIKGIGIRLSRGGPTVKLTYPGIYEKYGSDFTIEGSKFKLEIVKIAEVTGSGSIAPGQYSSYDMKGMNNPILISNLTLDGITIVSPSCLVESGENMNINMPKVSKDDFNGLGSTAGSKDFDIKLLCNGGATVTGYANINMSFSGRIPGTLLPNSGVLENESSDIVKAKGVGIQVTKNAAPIVFEKNYLIDTIQSNQTRVLSVPLTARYYQYENTISSGEVESHMVFNLNYD